ncbi:MAG: hypothetical protein F8N37_22925 [Telmatospirillum sp.]|nr:hypothetical protein [Telmatospirillum sp.]
MTDNVVRLNFSRRRMVATPETSISFTLNSDGGRWSLEGAQGLMTPAQVSDVADALREIARKLKDASLIALGSEAETCLGEFVLFENGGVDYWISPETDTREKRQVLQQGLRKALNSLSAG